LTCVQLLEECDGLVIVSFCVERAENKLDRIKEGQTENKEGLALNMHTEMEREMSFDELCVS
jgi:hypothetical protein